MPEHVSAFVSHGLWGDNRGVGECQAVGFWDGDFVAGVLFHNWTGHAIEMTAYSSRRDWLTAGRLRMIFAYPFDIGCNLAVARISEKNDLARRIWRALGAKEYVIPELRGPGEAECVFTLSAGDWNNSRFMRQYNGKTKISPSR